MLQIRIISGKMAGTEKVARHFPFRIGRSASADLRLEEDGVWDRHLELKFDAGAGFVLVVAPNAIAAIDGRPFQEAVLRNGDLLEIGALKIRFWLGEVRQYALGIREWLVWTMCALVIAGQFYLIYRVLP